MSDGPSHPRGRRMSLLDMVTLPPPPLASDGSETVVSMSGSSGMYQTAKTVDLAHRWTKGFKQMRLALPHHTRGRYEPSISEDSKSMRRKMMFVIPTDNTYKMEPDIRFKPDMVEGVISRVLEEELHDVTYSARDTQNVCKVLTVKIRNAVKELGFPRYRIVAHVTIGQRQRQSFQSVSRCLWDEGNDDYATASFKNESIFATATVWGVYFE